MYFQACSNSAYPMHSGERYRTIGPLVREMTGDNTKELLIFLDLAVNISTRTNFSGR